MSLYHVTVSAMLASAPAKRHKSCAPDFFRTRFPPSDLFFQRAFARAPDENNEINQKIPFDLRQIDIRIIRLRLVVAVVLLTFFNFSTTFQSPCSRKRHGFIILPLTLEKRVRASRCSAYLVRFPKINTFCDGKRKLVIFSKVPIDQRSMWMIVGAISGLTY